MSKLWNAINNVGMSKQKLAEMVKMPYYRVATILYGEDELLPEEEERIGGAFGFDVFYPKLHEMCRKERRTNQ